MIKSFDTLRKASNLPNWLRPLLQKVFKERRSNLIGNIRECVMRVNIPIIMMFMMIS